MVEFPQGPLASLDPLRTARQAVERGDFTRARELLRSRPTETPAPPEWHLLWAMTSWRLGEFAPSRASALQAKDLYRSRGDADGEMRSENVAAAGAFALGNLAEAEQEFSRVLTLAEQRQDHLMVARSANNLGNVLYYLGDHPGALRLYAVASAAFERLGSQSGRAESWHNTGIVWRDLERAEPALEAAEKALDFAQRSGRDRLIGQAMCGLGESHGMRGDTRLAQVQVQHALELARQEHDRLAEIEGLRVRAWLGRISHDLNSAHQLCREALRLAREADHPWLTAAVLQTLGEILGALERPDDSRRAFHEAAEHYRDMGASRRAQAAERRIP